MYLLQPPPASSPLNPRTDVRPCLPTPSTPRLTLSAIRQDDRIKRASYRHLPLREQVIRRTNELAKQAGRSSFEITQEDYNRAKSEITGETDPDRQNAILDATMAMNHGGSSAIR